MATSIGPYAISVKTDAREFEAGMARVVTVTQQTTQAIVATTAQTNQLASSARVSTHAIQALALGLQDAVSVLGTGGFRGAIQAAGNNIVQFGSLISPIGGTIAAFAVTGLQLMANQFKNTETAAKSATEAILSYTNTAKRIREDVRDAGALGEIGRIGDAQQAGKRAEDLERQANEAEEIAKRSREEIDKLNDLAAETRERIARPGRRNEPGLLRPEAAQARIDQLLKIRDEQMVQEESATRDSTRLRTEADAARKREAELTAQEYDAAFKKFDEERMKRAVEIERKAAEEREKAERDRANQIEQWRANARREVFQDTERRIEARKRVDPTFRPDMFGSQSAAETLARSRVQPLAEEQTRWDRQFQLMNEGNEILRNIDANLRDNGPDVIEDFGP